MKRTKHFGVWEWVDFVRGVSESAAWSAMNRHLASGCERCEGIVRVLRGVAEVASREAGYEPPERTLRRAVAIFPAHPPERVVVPTLVYDSFLEPLPAGMRAQDRLARHALYEAGDFFLDVQLEHEPASGVVTLVGQLSHRQNPATGAAELPVLLMAPRGLVASAMCNRLGEFQMEYKPARHLRLHVPLREVNGHLDVRMDELLPVPFRRAGTARRTTRRSGRKPSGIGQK